MSKTLTKERVCLGIDLGGTFVRIGFVRRDEYVYHVKKIGTAEVVDDFGAFVRQMIEQYRDEFLVEQIVLAVPGLVDQTRGMIASLPNIPALEGKPLGRTLETMTGLPVILDNDTNVQFVYDLRTYELENCPDVLGFYIGTGFGGALKLNGTIRRGEHGAAGEIAHIPIANNRLICGCGNTGCLETIASGVALKRIHKTHFKSASIEDVFSKHANHQAIQTFIKDIAAGIATAVNLLDVSTCLLGGGVIAMRDFPHAMLVHQIKSMLRSDMMRDALTIHIVEDKPDRGVIGAGLTGFAYKEASS